MKIDERITKLFQYREELTALKAQCSEVQQLIDEEEYHLIQEMERVGVESAGCDLGTARVKIEMYPQIKDQEAFLRWCNTNEKFDMVQKRVSKGSFDEYFKETGEFPDGLETYEKTTLSLRRK